ncbi:SUMO-1-ACTIVATING ENZYME E1A, putative [Babesia bigemina]|uniref:SUMO-1-ACTIVATING ENZYME E1A, putative n=1 Tax=Babesia bigemina TaxID=5866 RepID=A0A061D6A3_BABBI|nr:SUMO-1-ACTIVATING ENZYME E1A, putative [Babesia bigemina]CDR96221.1 SUMO-1-ACTIVATING ENZYME E1A, putative [Babesia bigemina]|eukprot:XP_012768407.1 SUMO-1-ACTIVATING ENZYME E1A, putative [Babesia bigemina]
MANILHCNNKVDAIHTMKRVVCGSSLSNQDALLYDRQIRLWGIEAQQRMMSAQVLFLGKNGIQEEAMKNLVLSGVGVTLANDLYVNEEDVKYSFLLRKSDIGTNHAKSLVYRLREMTAEKRRINFITDSVVKDEYLNGVHSYKIDESIIEEFEIVSFAAESYTLPKMTHVNDVCRQKGVAVIASMDNGMHGFLLQDLNTHTVYPLLLLHHLSVLQPRFPRNCDISIRNVIGYLLMQRLFPHRQDISLESPSFMIQLRDICDSVGGREADIMWVCSHSIHVSDPCFFRVCYILWTITVVYSIRSSLYEMRGKRLAITSGILGGYLALEIRKFITKQHETIPSLCVFDMARSIVTTAML